MVRVRMDFNEIFEDDTAFALTRLIDDGRMPCVGDHIEAYDFDGNVCPALVLDLTSTHLRLKMDLGSFVMMDEDTLVSH